MKIRQMSRFFALAFGFVPACLMAQEVVFTSDLDDGAGWSIVADDDTASEFGFDYSRFGIPSAPNGSGTTGLWMAANIVDPGAAAMISATPDDVIVSGRYSVEFDAWVNFNSSGGTTEFIGGFAGFDPAAGNPRSGAGILADSDGDSSRDYRLYKDANEQFIESGQFDIASNNNSDPALMAQFPGQTTPAEQGDSANLQSHERHRDRAGRDSGLCLAQIHDHRGFGRRDGQLRDRRIQHRHRRREHRRRGQPERRHRADVR